MVRVRLRRLITLGLRSEADRTDTKIDWDAYMQQVELFRDGERDYSRLVGETGPCV